MSFFPPSPFPLNLSSKKLEIKHECGSVEENNFYQTKKVMLGLPLRIFVLLDHLITTNAL